MTIVPRTGPFSASSALATTSWYQRGKSSLGECQDLGHRPKLRCEASRRQAGFRRRACGSARRAARWRWRRRPARRAARRGPPPRRPWPRRGRPSTAPRSTPCSSMNSAHSTSASTISSSGTTATFVPLTNRWPRLLPAAMPRSASRASPGPLTTQPITATCSGISRSPNASCASLGDLDHVDLGPAARRAGDEVDVLALAQAHRLEQLATGARLLDRIGGERVADGVADALGQQRGDAGGGLDRPAGGGPASVTPRCSGWSVTSDSCR